MPKKLPFILNLLLAGILVGLAFSLQPRPEPARAQAQGDHAILYFFWGNGCPHCAEAEPFLKDLVNRYPQAEVRAYEVWYNQDNLALFQKMATAFGIEATSVPGIFIGEKYWVGYTSDIGQEIESAVSACAENGCKDAGAGVVSGGVFDTWTSAGIQTASQNNTLLIIGLVSGAALLGLLGFFFFRPRKKRLARAVRRRR